MMSTGAIEYKTRFAAMMERDIENVSFSKVQRFWRSAEKRGLFMMFAKDTNCALTKSIHVWSMDVEDLDTLANLTGRMDMER